MRQTRRCALQRTSWNRRVVIGLLCSVLDLVGGGQGASLQAQTSITSSGLNTAISGSGTTTFIDGGTRPGGGPNLFHSFGEFSIGEGHTALFRNSDAGVTSNIFGRVTGNSVSTIFGTIDSATNFPTANLWLINPNGFLFGPTATLNVGGSVNISSADYLKMTDGTKFNALPGPADALLSMAPVEAFGFLERTTQTPTFGTITVRGSGLLVVPGKSLSLVGGDFEVTGRFNAATRIPEGFLFAPSGTIQLASVASAGEVVIGTTSTGAPDLKVDGFSRLGHISLSEVAILNASGDPGGTVQIRAGSLTADRSFIAATTFGNLSGTATALDLNVAGRILLQNGSRITAEALAGGRGGDIVIKSGTLDVTSAATITSTTSGNGDAGNVSIKSSAITLADSNSQIGSTTSLEQVGIGNGGALTIDAKTVDVTNGAGINNSTFGQGNAGPVTITATEAVRVSGQNSQTGFQSSVTSGSVGSGVGGTITVKAPVITVADQAQIFTSSTEILGGRAGTVLLDGGQVTIEGGARVTSSTAGHASGGTVRIQAADAITIASSGSLSADTSGDGDAGEVIIRTPTLTMRGGAISGFSGRFDLVTKAILPNGGRAGSIDIVVRNAVLSEGATIRNDTLTNGEGGSLVIVATEALRLSGSTLGSSTSGAGTAGRISVTAPSMTLTDEASIGANSSGAGPAGAVTLQAARLTLTGGSSVDSGTFGTGLGGTVTINASEQVLLTGSNKDGDSSQISAVTTGSATAGQITVTTPMLTIEKGAIFTNTGASGKAGSIAIDVSQLFLADGALISSRGVRSATGDAGSVNLQIRGLFLSQAGTVSSEAKTGAGGNVSITAGNIRLTDGTTIVAKTTGSKDAGGIRLTSADDILMKNSTVTTSAEQASGGDIKLTAPGVISLFDSKLTSSVKGQAGSNGGNISIDPVAVAIQNSQILTRANAGVGGNITIVSLGGLLVSPSSVLDASAGPAGISGKVNLPPPDQFLSGAFGPLKVSYSQPALSGNRCAADPQGHFSSFVQTGRDGVPTMPGAYAPSPLFVVDQLLSSSRGSQPVNLTAARLGLDRVGAASFQFHSACRS